MDRKSEREFWCEFLDIYRAEPSLWKTKSAEYHNRNMKSIAYGRLVDKLSEINPVADRDMAVKKINNFRTNYRKEFKRAQETGRLPTLWYYSNLSFLEDQEENSDDKSTIRIEKSPPTKQKNNQPAGNKSFVRNSSFLEDQEENSEDKSSIRIEKSTKQKNNQPAVNKVFVRNSSFLEDQEENSDDRPLIRIEKSPPTKKKKIKPADESIEFCDPLQTIRPANLDYTTENATVNSWAEQYNEISSDQKVLTRKIIYDVLFQGCMGKLTLPMVEKIYDVLHDRT